MHDFSKKIAGFTLVEMILSIAIILVVAGIVALNISSFTQGQALSNSVDEVTALINEARSDTLEAYNGTVYGVHLQSDKVILFTGSVYSSVATSNKPYVLDSNIVLNSISLNGSGSDVIFVQNTGDTTDYGTFIVKKSSTTAGQKTVTVSKTGIVSSN